MRIGMMEEHGYCIYWCQLRPESRGSVTLRSDDPMAPPRIVHNYLTAESDWAAQRRGLAMARELHARTAFDRFRGRELDPGEEVKTRDQIDGYLRAFSQARTIIRSAPRRWDTATRRWWTRSFECRA